jgi:hypothetical protein
MLCTQFYCNTPTHQESVWIHISVVSRSHFVITPSQSKSICPPLPARCGYTLRVTSHKHLIKTCATLFYIYVLFIDKKPFFRFFLTVFGFVFFQELPQPIVQHIFIWQIAIRWIGDLSIG